MVHRMEYCKIDRCNRPIYKNEVCSLHYRTLYNAAKNKYTRTFLEMLKHAKKCSVLSCKRFTQHTYSEIPIYQKNTVKKTLPSDRYCDRHMSVYNRTIEKENTEIVKLCKFKSCFASPKEGDYCSNHKYIERKIPKPPKSICKIENCNAVSECKELCTKHYQRYRSVSLKNKLKLERLELPCVCLFEECTSKKVGRNGYCFEHRKYGDTGK